MQDDAANAQTANASVAAGVTRASFADLAVKQIDDQIKLADAKAAFLLTVAGAMLGAVGFFRGGIGLELLPLGLVGWIAIALLTALAILVAIVIS
jgi:hypothetical protein